MKNSFADEFMTIIVKIIQILKDFDAEEEFFEFERHIELIEKIDLEKFEQVFKNRMNLLDRMLFVPNITRDRDLKTNALNIRSVLKTLATLSDERLTYLALRDYIQWIKSLNLTLFDKIFINKINTTKYQQYHEGIIDYR